MKTLETARLFIDELRSGDALFMLEMLNDPGFIKYVADRGVRTEEAARTYLHDRVTTSYEEHGFGMGAVRLKDSGEIIGMCGLIKRDTLEDIDIGYGFLPKSRGKGYALEAALAVMEMLLLLQPVIFGRLRTLKPTLVSPVVSRLLSIQHLVLLETDGISL